MRPIAERHGLTTLQLACAWNLAHAPVRCVAPTLIQEPGPGARPVEAKRAELAAVAALPPLSGRRPSGPGSQIAISRSARSCAISAKVRSTPEPVGYSSVKSSPKNSW